MSVRVGFIGLGNQGKPIAAHLAPAGFETTVYDLAEEPVRELVLTGARAGQDQLAHRLLGEVVDGGLEAGRREVRGDRLALVSETDEADADRHCTPPERNCTLPQIT